MITVRLSQFEGPMDALLHLISKARVDVKDIFLSEITEQYLASMEGLEVLDVDSASEFTQMASTLLEIKSRSLLPKPPKLEEDEEDPEKELIRRLEEYKRMKEASRMMEELETAAANVFYRLPEESAFDTRIELSGLTLRGLTKAFAAILARMSLDEDPERQTSFIRRETYTIQECMFRIQSRLEWGKALRFEALFEEAPTKSEAVTVFLALLELWKMGTLRIEQTSTYGPIDIYKEGAH